MFSKQVVVEEDDLVDPQTEITLEEALQLRDDVEVGMILETPYDTARSTADPHRGAGGQAGHLSEGQGSRARADLARVRRSHRRTADRPGQALRPRRHDRRPGTDRGRHPPARAVPRRALQPGRPDPGRADQRRAPGQGPAAAPVAGQRTAGQEAVRDGSPRDLRRHGQHRQRRRATPANAARSRSARRTATSIRSAPAWA